MRMSALAALFALAFGCASGDAVLSDACDRQVTDLADGDEALGVSEEAIQLHAAGEHALELVWSDGTRSPLYLRVQLGGPARYVQSGPGADVADPYAGGCADMVQTDVAVSLTTGDGRLREVLTGVLEATSTRDMLLSATLDLEEVAGTLRLEELERFDEVSLLFTLWFGESGEGGTVTARAVRFGSDDADVVDVVLVPVASW